MITCSRRIQFCAGHRVLNHESKCANPHGHNYVAWIHARSPELDSIGRVIDFSVLKAMVGGWIDSFWDHTFIVYEQDYDLIRSLIPFQKNKPLWIAPFNPTAENMAQYLLAIAPKLLDGTGVEVYKIELYETENCKADAILAE